MNLTDFIYQNGYGLFIWGAYGMAVLVLISELVLLNAQRKTVLTTIKRMMQRRTSEEQ